MSEFKNKSITSKGLELLSKALAGEQLTFTKIEMGSGLCEGDTGEATVLVQPQQILPITKISRKGGQVTLSASLKIEDVTNSFDWTEIGVYAKGSDGVEVLYMYGYTQNSSFISKESLNEKLINVTVMVSNATNITATIDNSLVYLTAEALKEHEQDANAHNGIVGKMVDNMSYNNNCLQLEANGKPVGDKVFITAGESVRVNMFKAQSDTKVFVASAVTDSIPLTDLKEKQIVRAVFDNLWLVEGVDFMVNHETKHMTLGFELEIGQKIYYTYESVSFEYKDLAGVPTEFRPSSHKHSAGDITGLDMSWNGITEKPTTFPPSTHTHSISNISGLQDELNYIKSNMSSAMKTIELNKAEKNAGQTTIIERNNQKGGIVKLTYDQPSQNATILLTIVVDGATLCENYSQRNILQMVQSGSVIYHPHEIYFSDSIKITVTHNGSNMTKVYWQVNEEA